MLPAVEAPDARLVARMDNVHIYVRDMARSLSFYRDVLVIPLVGDEDWMDAEL